jgi:hypothetical protein
MPCCKPEFVSRVQAPGELNGRVQDLLQARQLPVPNPIRQRAALYELREKDDLIAHRPEEPAGDQMGMLRQIDPGPQFGEEVASAGLVAEESPLHGEGLARGSATQQVDLAHAALTQLPFNHVVVENDLPGGPICHWRGTIVGGIVGAGQFGLGGVVRASHFLRVGLVHGASPNGSRRSSAVRYLESALVTQIIPRHYLAVQKTETSFTGIPLCGYQGKGESRKSALM